MCTQKGDSSRPERQETSVGKEQKGIVEWNKKKSLDVGMYCKLFEDKCGRMVLYLDGQKLEAWKPTRWKLDIAPASSLRP